MGLTESAPLALFQTTPKSECEKSFILKSPFLEIASYSYVKSWCYLIHLKFKQRKRVKQKVNIQYIQFKK